MTVFIEDPPHETVEIRFALEPYSESLVQEMRPLWDAHYEEIPQLGLKLDPDLTLYTTMQRIGTLRIFTARIGSPQDSTLCAYALFGVIRHPHRKYSLEAHGDILYMDPECRRGFTAVRFLQFCWATLEKEGVQVIHQVIDAKHDVGRLLERYGFEMTDLVYSRKA